MSDIKRENIETIIRLCTIDGYCENFEGRLEVSGVIDSDRVAKLIPIAHLITLDVERVLFHGDDEPVDDFYLDGRRNRHYYAVRFGQLSSEFWTTGADGGQPWHRVEPGQFAARQREYPGGWASIPAEWFPLLWKPSTGRES